MSPFNARQGASILHGQAMYRSAEYSESAVERKARPDNPQRGKQPVKRHNACICSRPQPQGNPHGLFEQSVDAAARRRGPPSLSPCSKGGKTASQVKWRQPQGSSVRAGGNAAWHQRPVRPQDRPR